MCGTHHLSQLLYVPQIDPLCPIIESQPRKTMIPRLVLPQEPPLLEQLVRDVVLRLKKRDVRVIVIVVSTHSKEFCFDAHLLAHHQPDPSITLMDRIIGLTRLTRIVYSTTSRSERAHNPLNKPCFADPSRQTSRLTVPGRLRIRIRGRPNRTIDRRNT
jgi:hypothetical protein